MEFEDWAEQEIMSVTSGLNIRVPSAHQSMFKYIGLNTKTSWDYLERMLNDLEILGSTANSLNDPFELSPFIFDDLRPSVIANSIGDRGYNLTDRLNGKPEIPIEEKYADVESYRETAKSYLSRIERNSRIICFCERSDSPLLWSHYANSYKGACLHFFGKAFSSHLGQIGYVNYTPHRPTFPLSLALSLASKPHLKSSKLRKIEADRMYFFSKAIDWSYENEMRIVYDITSTKHIKIQKDGLAAIILGPRMTEEDQTKLREMVRKSPLAHVPIKLANLSTNSYSVQTG